MTNNLFKKIRSVTVSLLALFTFVLLLPGTSLGEEFPLEVNVSPNIINIESERLGEIRIFTRMSYSLFKTSGVAVHVRFNDGDSVEDIRVSRDSWGNLILKFNLADLLATGCDLFEDAPNTVEVELVLNHDSHIDNYIGDADVYILVKGTL